MTNVVAGVRAEDPDSIARAIEETEPEVAINCIGVVKQSPVAADAVSLVTANALFPHQLAAACSARGVRLIHVSTDCVFSGRRGGYAEEDLPDPSDLYGRSKLAGEASGPGIVTIRASMIGHELRTRNGLLEWLLAQPAGGSVRGIRKRGLQRPDRPRARTRDRSRGGRASRARGDVSRRAPSRSRNTTCCSSCATPSGSS